jgi:hypothetical protein
LQQHVVAADEHTHQVGLEAQRRLELVAEGVAGHVPAHSEVEELQVRLVAPEPICEQGGPPAGAAAGERIAQTLAQAVPRAT